MHEHIRPQHTYLQEPRRSNSHRFSQKEPIRRLQHRRADYIHFTRNKLVGPKVKTKGRLLKNQEGRLSISHGDPHSRWKKKQAARQHGFAKHCEAGRTTVSSPRSLSALTASVLAWQRLSVYTVNIKITYNGYTSPSICQRSLRIEHFASMPPLIHRHANLLTVTQHQEVRILLIEGCRTCFVRIRWLPAQGWAIVAAMNFLKRSHFRRHRKENLTNKMAEAIVGQYSPLRT